MRDTRMSPAIFGRVSARALRALRGSMLPAWWELYVFTLFDSLGYDVQVHPHVGTGKRPDFLVSKEDDRTYVECMVLFEEESYAGSDSQAWLFERINDVEEWLLYGSPSKRLGHNVQVLRR